MNRKNAFFWLSIGFLLLGAWYAIKTIVLMGYFTVNLLDAIALHVSYCSPILLAMGVAIISRTGRLAKLSLWVLAVWWLIHGAESDLVVHSLFGAACAAYLLFEAFFQSGNARNRLRKLALPMMAVLVVAVPAIVLFCFGESHSFLLMSAFGGARIYFIYAIMFVASLGYDWVTARPN